MSSLASQPVSNLLYFSAFAVIVVPYLLLTGTAAAAASAAATEFLKPSRHTEFGNQLDSRMILNWNTKKQRRDEIFTSPDHLHAFWSVGLLY